MSLPDISPGTERAPAPVPASALPRPVGGDGDRDAAYVVALDVGGTGMKAALLDADGTPRATRRRPSPRQDGPDAMVTAVLDLAVELADDGARAYGRPPAAVGVAVPGILDEEAGVVRYAANLGWRDVPLRHMLRDRLGAVPVALGHDVRSGGVAEDRLGAGRGFRRSFFVALGTGIAGAIGIEGRIEPGAHGGAGELGHIVVRPGGQRCGCGQFGCLETVASAAAVTRAWAERSGDPRATAADAARAVAAGDTAATAVWQEAVDALADGLVIAITLLDPEVVIVGGGLAEAGETLFGPLRTALRQRLTYQREPAVVGASLGDTAGCLGAGLLAWDATRAALPPDTADSAPQVSAPHAAGPGDSPPAGGGTTAPASASASPEPSGPPTDTATVSGDADPQVSSAAPTPRRFQQP